MSDIGKMIRLRRKQLGMTQKELARLANVSQQTITALENGRTKRSKNLPELFQSLDLDISKALTEKNPSEPKKLSAYSLISQADFESILSTVTSTLSKYHEQHLDNGEPFIVNSLNLNEVTEEIGKNLAEKLHIESCN